MENETGFIDSVKSVIGLFVPMPWKTGRISPQGKETKWNFTIQVGWFPLGWIMILVALIVKWI